MLYWVLFTTKNKHIMNHHYSLLITLLTALLSLATAAGIFVHDMKIDKLAITAIAAPLALAGGVHAALSTELHPHAERGSLKQAVSDAQGNNPLLQPRSAHKNKKYLTKRKMLVGHRSLFGMLVPLS